MPRWSWIFFILLFISLVGLQIHNVRNYPVTNGFDARAHIEYIAWLKKHTSLPLATAGWEFHQPPLYYVVNQSLPTLKSSQVFGVLVWIVAAAVILLFFRKHCGPLPSIILTLLAAALPLGLYLSPAISNEWTSTVLLTIALSYYVNHFLSDTPQINQPKSETTVPKQLILGILLSLCLLTKVTAIVFVASLVLDQLVRKKGNILLLLRQTWLTLLTISVLSGWFFVRNWWLFGNPLFQAADYIPLSSFAQPIIERNVFFFSNLHPLLSLTLFEAQYTSFWGGTYLSWFYDGHGVLLPPQAFTKAGSLLISLWLPLFIAAVFGFIKSLISLFKLSTGRNTYHVFPMYTLGLFAAYIHYNFRLPFYSTVKAAFISSLILPFLWFVYLGLPLRIWRRKIIIMCYIACLVALTVKHFWIDPRWYS